MEKTMKKSLIGFGLGLVALVIIAGPAFADHAWKKISDVNMRFQVSADGMVVLDKETGLAWEQSPDTTLRDWFTALTYCYDKVVSDRKGWRLPTVEELMSLVDTTQSNPALPLGHPFNVLTAYYMSATTTADLTSSARVVNFQFGGPLTNVDKGAVLLNIYVWCVRGGRGHDGGH